MWESFYTFDGFDTFTQDNYIIEIEVNGRKQTEQLTGTALGVKTRFLALAEEVAHTPAPAKIKISKTEIIWDEINKRQKSLENYIEVENKEHMKNG